MSSILAIFRGGSASTDHQQDGSSSQQPIDPEVLRVVAESPLMDSDWYLQTFADVTSSGMSAPEHFVRFGASHGRDPGPNFSTRDYLLQYPDVSTSEMNPLYHWETYGRREGRVVTVSRPDVAQLAAAEDGQEDSSSRADVPRPEGIPFDEVAATVAASEFLDRDWYLKTNPDVKAGNLCPAEHYVEWGAGEGRDPGPKFSTKNYLLANPDVAESGVNPLWHWEKNGRDEGRTLNPAPPARTLIEERFPNNRGINLFLLPKERGQRRLTLITDSLGDRSLFGGVGTAIIISALLAKQAGASVRLCTRHETSDGSAFRKTLAQHGIKGPDQLECVTSWDPNDTLDWGDNDVALTTSWWTTRAALRSIPADKIVYLLQEDERCFYPDGDDRLRCAQTLARNDMRVLINTDRLYTHLCQSLPHLRDHGIAFEPAFPKGLYRQNAVERDKLNFIFYARPSHQRNLFWLGLESLDQAALEGLFDPADWKITFLGSDIPRIQLANGVEPRRFERLPWDEYAALIRDADLGLSLMASPHPSYPPLDLAASGAVVVTNSWEGKDTLSNVCANILTAKPTPPTLVEALREGAALAKNHTLRSKNYKSAHLNRSWEDSLSAAVDFASKAWPD